MCDKIAPQTGGFRGDTLVLPMFPRLFHKRSTELKAEKDDVSETLRTLIDARFDRIEQKQRALEREWSDVYDKIMLLYDRTRKRIAASKKAAEREQPTETIPTPPLTRDGVLRMHLDQNGSN